MIEKMKFLSITGPKSDFDRVVNAYLTKYSIHLENALTELGNMQDLKPFVESNPYKQILGRSAELLKQLDRKEAAKHDTMTIEEAADTVDITYHMLEDYNTRLKELKATKSHYDELIEQIEPIRNFDYDFKKLMEFKFIKFRFGRIAHEHYNNFSKYVFDNLNTIFFECDSGKDYVWGIYFTSAIHADKIDAIFTSLHFERVSLSDEYEGKPETAYRTLLAKRVEANNEIKGIAQQIKEQLNSRADELLLANETLSMYSNNFDVRKLAACTREKGKKEVFYILCGWIPEKEADKLLQEIDRDSNVYCVIEEGQESTVKPPTKLKNPRLFKPFEMFVRMYGVPAYNEIDPTSFIAITYSLIFGIMFGDVGQGLCLVVGGALLYQWKKMNLAAIISVAGVFSTIFGFLYGSIFGYEDILPALWLSPMHNVMTVLISAVGFGVFLILLAMIINVVNAIKEKNISKLLFDTNGLTGLVFYGAAISCVILVFTGHALPATILLVIFFGIPLLLLFFKEPLTHLLERKKEILPEHKVMFFVETFFELFEILLSYVTNTISFLRVGAFALSHAAMMGVVLLLAGAETGSPNILVLIIGNIVVTGMEGLIVGIQVLRLEYYEMFSRFYKGTGKEFKPYSNK